MKNHRIKGTIYALAYLATIVLAAWMVAAIGPVPVGFGLYAPAAAYIVGITMVLRDLTQDQLGPWATYAALVAGTILSALVSPGIALAAAAAWLVSETLDQLVYTPLRKRSLIVAVVASNLVGILADSAIFLWLAFGNFAFFPGQVWAKLVATVAAVVVLKVIYRHRTTHLPAYLVARQAVPA